ncbi:MAG: prepilin-type N-terminal cleavage/methylation domain-containing protein [Verrucomicrobiota bacterium]
MPRSNKFPLLCRRRGGFTLVEVVIALGIFVVAFVSIMALLPASLGNLNEAGNTSLRSQITRNLTSELRQISFLELKSSDPSGLMFYYTSEGLPAEDGTREAVVSAEILSLDTDTQINDDKQDHIARATVAIRLHGREIDRTIIFLPDTGS